MNRNLTVLIDPERAGQFARLGSTGLRPRCGGEVVVDRDGVPWAVWQAGPQAVAVCGLGPGWALTPAGRETFAGEWAAIEKRFKHADASSRTALLHEQLAGVRLGDLARRLGWFIHGEVMAQRTSLLHVPDVELGIACYGQNRMKWPRHWRQEILSVAEGLTRVHFANWEAGAPVSFGANTVALNYVADLRGKEEFECPPECPRHGHDRHDHVEIDVGPGFLGSLELFGSAGADGVRTYEFTVGTKKSSGPSLHSLGKQGRIRECFVPVYLGEPNVCEPFTTSQVRLLQCICREHTRKGKKKGKSPVLIAGGRVPAWNGAGAVTFGGFDTKVAYAGFNGNGVRSGLGYRLFTAGGWMARAGYGNESHEAFFADLQALADPLGLVVIGIAPSGRVYTLTEMAALARTRVGQAVLRDADVRVYTPEGYLDRWSAYFRWPPPAPAASDQTELILRLELAREERRLSFRAVARQLELHPSFLSRLLQGKKKWPAAVARRVAEWVTACPTLEATEERAA